MGMKKVVAARASILLAVAAMHPSRAEACSCAYEGADGFLTGSAEKGGQPSAVHLPANARGVLFVVPAWAPVPPATTFSAFDETSKTMMSVSVRELVVPTPGPEYDRMTARDPRCLKSFEPARQSGCELPPRPTRSDHVLRLEPSSPFVPGHEYTFTATASSRGTLRVAIDSERLSPDDLGRTLLTANGPAATKEVPVWTVVGSCSLRSLSVTQEVRFDLPSSLAPYKHLLRHVLLAAPKGRQYRVWEYLPSLCSEIPFGRSAVGPSTDLFLIPCAEDPFTDLTAGSDYLLRGRFGVLEVEDLLRESAELPVRLDRQLPGQCGIAAATLSSSASPSVSATTPAPTSTGGAPVQAKAERVPRACGCSATATSDGSSDLIAIFLQTLAAAALFLRFTQINTRGGYSMLRPCSGSTNSRRKKTTDYGISR